LKEPVDRTPTKRRRRSQVDVYRADIDRWLAQGLTATKMLAIARADLERPYAGSRSVFGEVVRRVRQERTQQLAVTDVHGRPAGVGVLVFDNMKTVTSGRDADHQPVWTQGLLHLAAEFGFHPQACDPAAGKQKGSVESLVKWVKAGFGPDRTVLDDADLAEQAAGWVAAANSLMKVN
jgi:hypothetical protein